MSKYLHVFCSIFLPSVSPPVLGSRGTIPLAQGPELKSEFLPISRQPRVSRCAQVRSRGGGIECH